jgi:hypothetical protein
MFRNFLDEFEHGSSRMKIFRRLKIEKTLLTVVAFVFDPNILQISQKVCFDDF